MPSVAPICYRSPLTTAIDAIAFMTGVSLGQGLLAGLFVFLALCGAFTFSIVLGVTMLGAITCAASLWLYRHELRSACADAAGDRCQSQPN